jgi:nitrate reductase NapD
MAAEPHDAGAASGQRARRGVKKNLLTLGGCAVNISSAIVYALPQCSDSVRDSLRALPGLQIHHEGDDGRFIVTVEDGHGSSVADTVMQLHRLDGVLSAAMVYQYSDDEPRPEGAQP